MSRRIYEENDGLEILMGNSQYFVKNLLKNIRKQPGTITEMRELDSDPRNR